MWTRWPSEIPFNLSYCMIMWINVFLMRVLPLGGRAGMKYLWLV